MNIPRRARLDLNTQAELRIRDAIGAVEELGAHPILTDIVVGLDALRNKLADYLESAEYRSAVPPSETPGGKP